MSKHDPVVDPHQPAFWPLYEQVRPVLVSSALHLTGNLDDAEDLVQEAALQAHGCFDRFIPGTHFDRLLIRIMTNRFIDQKRRQRRVGIVSLDQGVPGTGGAIAWDLPDPGEAGDPVARLLAGVLEQDLVEAMAFLPPEYRELILLVDLEGMAYREAAERLGIPVGTVRSRLHRARATLATRLAATRGEPGSVKRKESEPPGRTLLDAVDRGEKRSVAVGG
ncbi:MAG: RNA polymerase sigma factor [Armatimonadetes bacterium]|nr:RNA polymerase sigma factor [Armatimonadota bacterium]